MVSKAAILLTVILMHFCSPIPALNALAPRDGITVTQDLAYAEGPRHQLDVYAPVQAAAAAASGPQGPIRSV